jgi:hypothetical protein
MIDQLYQESLRSLRVCRSRGGHGLPDSHGRTFSFANVDHFPDVFTRQVAAAVLPTAPANLGQIFAHVFLSFGHWRFKEWQAMRPPYKISSPNLHHKPLTMQASERLRRVV